MRSTLRLEQAGQPAHIAYRGLFAAGDDSSFLAAIRDATNGGFALVGETLRSRLTTDQQLRLQRRSSGPKGSSASSEGSVPELRR